MVDSKYWKPARRDVLKTSAAIGAGTLLRSASFAQAQLRTTPEQILGPFYPVSLTPNRSGDLAMLPGHAARAKGQLMVVIGRVLNRNGEPVRGARIEIWQANAVGRYAHPSDTNTAPVDPDFEGFGVSLSDADGRYRFRTIKPAAYPTGPTSFRPAHIHFDVSGRQDRLVTQMYFDGDPYNDKDRFLQSLRQPERLIVKLQSANAGIDPEAMVAAFDIVLAKG
jgi:protocatechuate 3,4-dioxygenase beta subunit